MKVKKLHFIYEKRWKLQVMVEPLMCVNYKDRLTANPHSIFLKKIHLPCQCLMQLENNFIFVKFLMISEPTIFH
jgi:hypothetical protein